jgi:hypothetical protein
MLTLCVRYTFNPEKIADIRAYFEAEQPVIARIREPHRLRALSLGSRRRPRAQDQRQAAHDERSGGEHGPLYHRTRLPVASAAILYPRSPANSLRSKLDRRTPEM